MPAYSSCAYCCNVSHVTLCWLHFWLWCIVLTPSLALVLRASPYPLHYCYCPISKGRVWSDLTAFCVLCRNVGRQIRLQDQVFEVNEPLRWSTGETSSSLQHSMETWTISDLVCAAVICVCRQFNTSAVSDSTACVFCLLRQNYQVQRLCWYESSTSSKAMCSEEAEAGFRLLFGMWAGAENLSFFSALRCFLEVAVDDARFHTFRRNTKTCRVWPDPSLHDCTIAECRGWLARLHLPWANSWYKKYQCAVAMPMWNALYNEQQWQ